MKLKSIDLVLIALMTALLIVLSLVAPIPIGVIPVPVTLQLLGVMLVGLILGPLRAALVVLLYVSMALVGIPVLPGGRAGLAVLTGPTGGFLLGMIPGASVVGWLGYQSEAVKWRARSSGGQIARGVLAGVAGGVVVVYALGVPWMIWVTGLTPIKAMVAVAIFIPIDIVKAVIASVLAYQVKRSINV
ncbi:biotin transport system substrate-specific component [Jezberella montanilacus]|jgi:biotin transport system substrate-specific component|uniref:Biotin transporter n=1 Tax=Jezberella montanilacus TaxID=323426 RepID=A0A2T0XFA6_9BURK|nr:biotin transporter BioY [Jezberella montanilacus]PRY97607.1 biotin transport system substrate-specific component [Jezberella montanilacus]